MSAIFKTVAWQAGSLISSVENGTIQLPDLQRPFVWPGTKVRDLFDSMYRGYPVGELMFWDVSADGETRAIAGASAQDAQHQIVDGQQRLTSLYAAVKGQPVRDENYRDKKIAISFNPFTEKFEVQTPAFMRSAEWVADISTCFESPIEALQDFLERYEESGREIDREKRTKLGKVFVKLHGLQNYSFDVVHIQKDVEKRTVADIFVRINSEGVSLKAYDYILTWLSVFWPDGREQIEDFARNSRMSPAHASAMAKRTISWTAQNPFIDVETGHVVRAVVAIGQNRAKLTDAYNALQAKDRSSGLVDSDRQERELDLLKEGLPVIINPLHWQEFIRSVQTAGFRSRKGITSNMSLVSSYVYFLLGRTRYGVDLPTLRVLTARWLFMSQLTSRYSTSSESQLQKDLDRFSVLGQGDAAGFARITDETIATELTADFWAYRVPDLLITSIAALSPAYQCYMAVLNAMDADMFMLDMKVRDWMDPNLPVVKGVEGHHLFPRSYQEKVLGTTDIKRINQAANFAPTDWDTNIFIGDKPPAQYWAELVASRGADPEWLARQHYWHALPHGWEKLDYEEFLAQRRRLIAEVIRDGYLKLSKGEVVEPTDPTQVELPAVVEPSLRELIDQSLLSVGDFLDPVDPNWVVDAAVTDDGTIMIDGVHEFDSLDEAAHHLGVTSMSGYEFWALETEEGLVPLRELQSRVINT
ncbi:MAG: DUF262 domain-containing protein [Microcella pacifica]|uniref:DUF262 domain-containing protein n=1 Tax=Microcella pacifica TaxID=2591847 RepID=A0A9E5JQW2_9MICO|nr:DUF262 domain-containing protein [Microcella pacifica]NHF63296.1 DUF262 domain-containing protein [Microcella pacifica]